MTHAPAPDWFSSWDRRFTWREDDHMLQLTCRRCGDVLAFTRYATEQTIRAEMQRHVYGRDLPPDAPECREGS